MTLWIVRGLPGSGKSTFAQHLKCLHLEADAWHTRDNKYEFNLEKAGVAHAWCLASAVTAMTHGMDLVVSNTFTRVSEITPYTDVATKLGYTIRVVRMTGNYGSTHGVPPEVMTAMRDRFEDYPGEVVDNE